MKRALVVMLCLAALPAFAKDTLNLYTSMPPKQAKSVFMTMTDDTMIQYLRVMEGRPGPRLKRKP